MNQYEAHAKNAWIDACHEAHVSYCLSAVPFNVTFAIADAIAPVLVDPEADIRRLSRELNILGAIEYKNQLPLLSAALTGLYGRGFNSGSPLNRSLIDNFLSVRGVDLD